MKKFIFIFFAIFFSLPKIFSQGTLSTETLPPEILPPKNPDLLITPQDIRIERAEDGYNLFIKKKPKLGSVMLTETTKDPLGKEPNYAYRAKEWNEVNGDEIRLLDGNILDLDSSAPYSLIDSTVQKDAQFGRAFLIFIPEEMIYGNPDARHGTVKIGKGTFVNIRGFEKKYCDYRGAFFDNPYMFDFERRTLPKEVEVVAKAEPPQTEEKPLPNPPLEETTDEKNNFVLTDDYNPIAADKFKEISDLMIYSKGPDSLLDDISVLLGAINPKNIVDVVFAIDATGSMKDDIEMLRERLIERLKNDLKKFGDVRLGLLLYRDYEDNFNTKGLPVKCFDFTSELGEFEKNLNSFKIVGTEGGDIPEAVYEALYASMEFYKWREDAVKKVILIGDAEPHPAPRRSGKYTKELVEKNAADRDISISAIITPDDKKRRGRK